MTAISIQDLNVYYRTAQKHVRACRDVSLDILKSDSLGIVGESGSGKSTLALAVLRLLPPNIAKVTGSAFYGEHDLISTDIKTLNGLRWKEIAIVFQKSMNSLSPVHKISNQMISIYRVHEPNADLAHIKERIFELFDLVNLPDRVYNLYPHELSGGMMQRVSIAVSLMHNPKVLIMDEATTALDVVTQGQILKEIIALESKLALSRVMITHDISVVASTCNRIAVMYAGALMELGQVKDVLVEPQHPYTRALKRSFPSFRGEKTALRGIPGKLPDLSVENKGCMFKDRCSYATEICKEVIPPCKNVSNNWQVYCHHAGELHD